jgi:membrane associated rhomboid family serine protease
MIPLGDSEAARRLSLVNTAIFGSNVAIFGLELWCAKALPLTSLALVPQRISHLQWSRPGSMTAALFTLVSSQFLHAGTLHVAGNMLFLLVFGPAVEGRLGHVRFIAFYLAAGIIACLATVAMAPQSSVPVVGASGAIAGVLGGYLVLHPRGRIRTLLPAAPVIRPIEIPAIGYLLAWFAMQLYFGISSEPGGLALDGVAWWSHVGGFLFGVAVAPLISDKPHKSRRARPRVKISKKRQP